MSFKILDKLLLKRSFGDFSNEPILDPLCHLRFLTYASSPRLRGWELLPFISKDSAFDAINALQISFNYFCSFKNYLGVSALSKHPVYIYIYIYLIWECNSIMFGKHNINSKYMLALQDCYLYNFICLKILSFKLISS